MAQRAVGSELSQEFKAISETLSVLQMASSAAFCRPFCELLAGMPSVLQAAR